MNREMCLFKTFTRISKSKIDRAILVQFMYKYDSYAPEIIKYSFLIHFCKYSIVLKQPFFRGGGGKKEEIFWILGI